MTRRVRMRTAVLSAWMATLLLGLLAGRASADGGVLVLDGADGPFLITVFAAPAPLRAGPVDLDVLVRDARTGQPILDAEVRLELERVGGASEGGEPVGAVMDEHAGHGMHDMHDMHGAHAGPPGVLRAIATREAATNKLLRAALIDLPAAGEWRLTVTVSRAAAMTAAKHESVPGLGVVQTSLVAGPPLPAWISRWKVLLAPPLIVALFLANQLLAQRRRSVRREATRPSRGSAAAP